MKATMNPLAPIALLILVVAALAAGGSGCAPAAPADPGVPKEATLLPPGDRTGMAIAGGSLEPETWQPDAAGALYVYDASAAKLAYSGPVEPADAILIYPTGVAVAGRRKTLSGRVLMEKRVATFDAGRRYRVYFQPGAAPVNPTTDPALAPTTRPYTVRERVVDPAGILRKDK
jgi:hypothetical protein